MFQVLQDVICNVGNLTLKNLDAKVNISTAECHTIIAHLSKMYHYQLE